MVRTLEDCEDLEERKLVGDVARVGWAVVGIAADGEGPAYAFTVGLSHSQGHPELVVFGLPMERAIALLNDMGAQIKAGKVYAEGQRYADLVHSYETRVDKISPRHHKEYLGFCRWFYRGDAFSALQVVWPDPQHRFPEEPDFESRLRPAQPLLSE